MEIPNLRGLRQLEPAERESTPEKKDASETRTWSRTQGTVFAIGMFAAVVGAALATLMFYFHSTIDATIPIEFQKGWGDEQIDLMKSDETFDWWTTLRDAPLRHDGPPPWVNYAEAKAQASILSYIFITVAILGVICTISSFFLPRANYGPKRRGP